MTERVATCRCGQLRATLIGEPVRVSVCHCLECQRRSGSAFAVQARWPHDRFSLRGSYSEWATTGDSGAEARFRFCPTCATTVAYVSDGLPDLVAIPVGTFADPAFPPPIYSVYENRKHAWVTVSGDGIDHFG